MSLPHEWRGGASILRSAAVRNHTNGGTRALGTEDESGAAPSLWLPPGAVGRRCRFVESGCRAAANAADKPRKNAASAFAATPGENVASARARGRGAPLPLARRELVRRLRPVS